MVLSVAVITAESTLFFFFQAEDGIRDKLVTGVQTCALPISGGGSADRAKRRRSGGRADGRSVKSHVTSRPPDPPSSSPPLLREVSIGDSAVRSEERRVGKECRSRWSPYH